MTILIKLPMVIYRGFLGCCPSASREYAILKNSVVVPTQAGDSIVEILCQYPEAKLIFERANQFYPDAAPFRLFSYQATDLFLPNPSDLFVIHCSLRHLSFDHKADTRTANIAGLIAS